ncbi:MAG: 30S ribosomal protein S10 [Candidatus Nezhaarchaeota archaeon]|nr:30S ribosomal protein S10 [Candidatus Nezhaarchaeota archaeon]MCX8141743.1 30S ribosomal protein S10 [Candidatus Nezhaarchaeota archaeon]MDW8050479.1 30S ribosomal protein S10 [Nitrososphaerota archaeon]
MARKARIRLSSPNLEDLQRICEEIKAISQKTGVRIRGPIPLPTKRLVVTTRKAPSGQGSHTFDHWEMKIHKRLIDMDAEDRALKSLMRVRVPDTVNIEIELV